MENMEYVYMALFVIGVILVFAAAFRKQAGFLKGINPVAAGVIGVLLIVPGFMWGIYPYLDTPPAQIAGEDITVIVDDTGTVQYPTFEITPAYSNETTAGSKGPAKLNIDEDTFTLPFVANTTQHDIYQGNGSATSGAGTSWWDPKVQFDVSPVPFAGANADDLATIFFEILEPELEVDAASSGPYYTFVKTGGKRQIEWTTAGSSSTIDYTSGSRTMLMTGNVSLQLTLELDEASLSRMQTTYDTMTFHAKFSNGGGWSETFTFTLIPLSISTTSTPDVW